LVTIASCNNAIGKAICIYDEGGYTMQIAVQINTQWKALVTILALTVSILHVLAAPSLAISYIYDEMNRLTEAHYDSTNWLEYKYDQLGNLTDKIPHGNVVTITPIANPGGSITPSGTVTYFVGGSGSFTIQPASGYFIGNVTVDGVSKGATLSGPYSVPFANVTNSLVANFKAGTGSFVINFTAGSNGSLAGATPQTVNFNGSTTAVSAIPATGYSFLNWTGTGGFVTTNGNPLTVYNISADQNITATFAINTYPVIFVAGSGGGLTGATSQTIKYGSNATPVTAVAAAGYYFLNWTGTGNFVTATDNPLTVNNVSAGQGITANFVRFPVRIARATPVYFQTIQDAYNASVDGDIIQSQALVISGDLIVNHNISVILDGGYSLDFSTKTGNTNLKGVMTTTAGGGNITVKDLVIQK
jgi:YD repeat-containing protein